MIRVALALAVSTAVIVAASTALAASNPPVVHISAAAGYPKTFKVRVPSSAMEPTLHCARPAPGCLAAQADVLVMRRLDGNPHRGDVVELLTPGAVCGAPQRERFVKRVIGLPGDRVDERLIDGHGYVFVNGKQLHEPYIRADRRDSRTFSMLADPRSYPHARLARGMYFVLGDNRAASCDSRDWGPVPAYDMIGVVTKIERYA